ncbi:MAG TPA: hypothetical protein PLX31_17750, partial [Gemmatimonadaceae bacterium]|nr:hypothetical protein [Gemmatimonadaceae bacterium]
MPHTPPRRLLHTFPQNRPIRLPVPTRRRGPPRLGDGHVGGMRAGDAWSGYIGSKRAWKKRR